MIFPQLSAFCLSGVFLKHSRMKDRVAHAYYDYGRFCSAHPFSCLVFSILTIILLSYPMVNRLKLTADSPVQVFGSSEPSLSDKGRGPKWLAQKPSTYVQHIIIHAQFENTKALGLSSEKAVKDLLSHVFGVEKILSSVFAEEKDLTSVCYQVPSDVIPSLKDLPSSGCMVLSPSLFWRNNEQLFYNDDNVVKTVFASQCTAAICIRDLFLGMPTRATGIKKAYQKGLHVVNLDYGVTLFLAEFDEQFILSLKNGFTKKFDVVEPASSGNNSFLHVFYRPRKYVINFLPLITSYVLLMFYVYFSVSKIVMVKSKWGLALAAVVTVAATSTMTAGICLHFSLMPTLWGAELFPYLALVVGLENTLCLTRSVVYTPPTMDVPSRISHGLSQEGYSFTKYFLLEMGFLFAGYLTFVPEIQEFCVFAWIGLVIDFYMQLFFYAPCLTFDLLRLDPEDKQRFSSMLFYSDIRCYKNYAPPRCPVARIWPRLFDKKAKLFRVKSDPQLRDYEANSKAKKHLGHRRTTSSLQGGRNTGTTSTRMRLLYFWTRTRIVQRAVMIVFVIWTIWIGFIVQNWRFSSTSLPSGEGGSAPNASIADKLQGTFQKNKGSSDRTSDVAVSRWKNWYQQTTFRWWPALFDKYNLSLSGHYITVLPSIFLKATVRPNEASMPKAFHDAQVFKDQITVLPSLTESLLMTRIYNLETQMAVVLVISAIILVATVGIFLLYVCFWERNQKDSEKFLKKDSLAANETKGFQGRVSRKLADLEPILFAGHKLSIECIGVINSKLIASSCFEGKVYVWNVATGKRMNAINRRCWKMVEKDANQEASHREENDPGVASSSSSCKASSSTALCEENHKEHSPPQIWCMAVRQYILFLGCADGTLEIAYSETGSVIGIYGTPRADSGIVHLLIRGNRVALARLSGVVELLDICFSLEKPFTLQTVKRIACVRTHRLAITHFEATSLSLVTISQDRIIRVFDIRSSQLIHTLNGHKAAIISVCIDQMTNVLHTSSEEGIICSWDLENGRLIRTIDEVSLTNEFVELACTASMLLGYSSDGHLWIWDKSSGQLNTRITPEAALGKQQIEKRCLTVVNNQIAATSCGASILFWDLNYKVMAKQVCIDGPVDKLLSLNQKSVICCSARRLYRIDVPVIQFG